MAKVNDLQCVGDALFQGDVKVDGKINGKSVQTNSNAKIIEFCKDLDLSAINNEVKIDIPDGYFGTLTANGSIAFAFDTRDGEAEDWTTNAAVEVTWVKKDDSIYTGSIAYGNLAHDMSNTFAVNGLIKSYIKLRVTTAAVGTNPRVMIYGSIYCKKI